jgi:putative transposase
MVFPLALGLAADRIPIAVTCRVLAFSEQAFLEWRADPVSQRDWDNAHLTNATIDLHRDNPGFEYAPRQEDAFRDLVDTRNTFWSG